MYSEPSTSGPTDPASPISGKVLFKEQEGSRTSVTGYEDGSVYEVSMPKGGLLTLLLATLTEIGEGSVINCYDPADDGDYESEYFYLSVWVPNEGRQEVA